MSRKKVTKKVKAKKTTATKRPVKTTVHSPIANLEKNLKDAHTKLIAHCEKELKALTQQDKKLQSELKKAQQQKKTAQKQAIASATKHKAKPSNATKKQLAAHKQTIGKITKTIAEISTRIGQLKLQSKTIAQTENKHRAITKLITAFEKQWEQKLRQAAKPKARKKTTKTKTLAVTTRDQQPATPQITRTEDSIIATEQEFETVE